MGRQVSAETIRVLSRQRIRMILLELSYFILLLVIGVLVFLNNLSGIYMWVLIAGVLGGYIFMVRPINRRYLSRVREHLLLDVVCAELKGTAYEPKSGVSRQLLESSGLFPIRDYPLGAHEHIIGRYGSMELEMSDVTFPITFNGRNDMFNGVYLHLVWPGAAFPELTVRSSITEAGEPTVAVQKQLEELESFIPGNFFARTEGDSLHCMFRGRLLGISLNPLMAVTPNTMSANIFPELKQVVCLAQTLRLASSAGKKEKRNDN